MGEAKAQSVTYFVGHEFTCLVNDLNERLTILDLKIRNINFILFL